MRSARSRDKASKPLLSKRSADLSELLFVEVVRRYLQDLPPNQTGWLAGVIMVT